MPRASTELKTLRCKQWPKAVNALRVPSSHDRLCAAYYRRGADIVTDTLVGCDEHVLVVVEAGALVLESSQCRAAVNAGDSALVAAGKVRVTEAPEPGCEVAYWMIVFGPSLLREVLGEGVVAENFARHVAPVYAGIYPQRRTRMTLLAHRLPTPVADVIGTFKVLLQAMSASVFMFLQHAFFSHRTLLQQTAIYGLADEFPGGVQAFQKLFRLYHGTPSAPWLKRQRKRFGTGRDLPRRTDQMNLSTAF